MDRPVARAIVIHDRSLLVNERKTGHEHYFALPGGGIEADETAAEAAVRELFEETSIVADNARLVYVYDSPAWGRQEFYYCSYVSGTPALQPNSREAADHARGVNQYFPQWVALDALGSLNLYPEALKSRLGVDHAQSFAAAPITLQDAA